MPIGCVPLELFLPVECLWGKRIAPEFLPAMARAAKRTCAGIIIAGNGSRSIHGRSNADEVSVQNYGKLFAVFSCRKSWRQMSKAIACGKWAV